MASLGADYAVGGVRPSQNGAWTHLVLFFGIDASSLPSHTGALVSRLGPAAQLVVAIVIGALLSGGALVPDARGDGARPVLGRARPRLFGLDPPGRGEPGSLRRRPRADRGSRRRDVGGPRRGRRHGDDRPVRREGGRLRGLHGPEAPRRSAGRRPLRRLPAIRGERLPEGSRSRPHGEDRHRHELRRGDGAGCQAPSGRRRPTGADPVHRWQARRQGRPGQPGAGGVRDRLFGTRSPFALLPVGMGLQPTSARRSRPGSSGCGSSGTCPRASAAPSSTGRRSCSSRPTRRAMPSRSRSRTPPARSPSRPRPPMPVDAERPSTPPTLGPVQGIRLTARRRPDRGSSGPRARCGGWAWLCPSSTTGSAAAPATGPRSNRPRACRSTGPPSSKD